MSKSVKVVFDGETFTIGNSLLESGPEGWTVTCDKCSFSRPETGRADIKSFLRKLQGVSNLPSRAFGDLKAIIDNLPTVNFEAIVSTIFFLKLQLPTPPKDQVAPAWPEYLLEKLPICLDADLLAKHCKAYPWYLAASRRAVTIAHMSEKGLGKDFLRFVDRLTKTNPALAFALSPTTLHDNTLVAPKVARYFTCSPFGDSGTFPTFDPQTIVTDYKPVFLNEKSDHVKLGAKNHFDPSQPSQEKKLAMSRLQLAIKGIYDKDGSFPWLHPSRSDTGVILAGGLPCAVMLDEAKWQFISQTTDIDLFIYGDSEEDRKDMTRIVLEHLEKLGGKVSHFVSVFKVDGLGREIQVVCPYARSPLGVLINFDTTFIQVGYQAGNFLATPGYCFFTPRSETLITRYNVRFHRMLKAIERGFMPVSDDRGHLMYPTKTLFSSRWPFSLSGSKPRTEEWVDDSARSAYLVIKKMNNISIGALKTMSIADTELFDVLLEEFREKMVEFNQQQKVHMEVHDLEANKSDTDKNKEGKATKKTIVADVFLNTSKPEIAWIPTTTAEAMKTFHPQGATLSNGFDIYTAGVNSTLPIPEDGHTDDIYVSRVLLRNVQVLPSVDSKNKDGKKTYNLAAPKDKPLIVKHIGFLDASKQYPADKYCLKTGTEAEPVREIEGLFLFADVKDPKILDSEYQQYVKRREENAAKFKRMVEMKRTARHERLKQKQKKRHDLENQRRAAKGMISLEEQAELDRKAIEARRKLQQAKDEAFVATKNAKQGIAKKKPIGKILEEAKKSVAEPKPLEKEPAFILDGLKFNHPEWDTFTDKMKNVMIETAKIMLESAKREPLTAQKVAEIFQPGRVPREQEASIAKTFNGAILNQSLTTERRLVDLAHMEVPVAKDKEELYEVQAVGPNAKPVQTVIPPAPLGFFTVNGDIHFPTPANWNQRSRTQRAEIVTLISRILQRVRDLGYPLGNLQADIAKILQLEKAGDFSSTVAGLSAMLEVIQLVKPVPGGLLDKPTVVPDGYFMVEDRLFPMPSGWGRLTNTERHEIGNNIKRILNLGRDKDCNLDVLVEYIHKILRREDFGHTSMNIVLNTKYYELEKQVPVVGCTPVKIGSAPRGSFQIEAGISLPMPTEWYRRPSTWQNEISYFTTEIFRMRRKTMIPLEALKEEVSKILLSENNNFIVENLKYMVNNNLKSSFTMHEAKAKVAKAETESKLADVAKSSSKGGPNSVAQMHGTVTPVSVKKVEKKPAKERLREAQRELDEEERKRDLENREKRNFSLRTTIDFEDLHRQLVVPKDVVTIGVHELPLLYKAFAKGGKQYLTLNKEIVKRSTGMVRVRAPVTFDDCLMFDVDDLFLPAKSVDNHPERRYNAVVNLSNLERWIIAAHEHKDLLTSTSSRELIMAALQEEMKKQDVQLANTPVAEFMRAIRHVANQKEFEEKANQLACYKAHPHPGLPGEMPTLFISRLYVSRI
jgi:hypothetical protein